MTKAGLTYINQCMNVLQIPYEFMEWTSTPVPNTYWVGEYTEVPSINEDGLDETDFIITGTTNQKYIDLETVKERIKEYFPNEGRTAILANGAGIAVCYSNSFPVPSMQEGIYRLQINLNIKEWKG